MVTENSKHIDFEIASKFLLVDEFEDNKVCCSVNAHMHEILSFSWNQCKFSVNWVTGKGCPPSPQLCHYHSQHIEQDKQKCKLEMGKEASSLK